MRLLQKKYVVRSTCHGSCFFCFLDSFLLVVYQEALQKVTEFSLNFWAFENIYQMCTILRYNRRFTGPTVGFSTQRDYKKNRVFEFVRLDGGYGQDVGSLRMIRIRIKQFGDKH